MKYLLIVLLTSLCLLCGCENEIDIPEIKTGTVTGSARFLEESNHSGINIALEKSNGLTTTGDIYYTASTVSSGSFIIKNVEPGNYTIYASSTKSLEKVVSRNITVEKGEIVTVNELKLTPVGEIKGSIKLDNNDVGNSGLMVFLEGTSFVAITDDSGFFVFKEFRWGQNTICMFKRKVILNT